MHLKTKMIDKKAVEIQKNLILDDLKDIDDAKKKGISEKDLFKKLLYESGSYDLFEIAFKNSDNKIKAEKEMNSFISKLGETVLIKTAFVIINFSTSVAKGKSI